MTQLTTLLENESGVQNNGVTDGEQQSDGYPIHGLIVGYFRRGRLDRSMTITNKNIRGMLGYDFQSPYYRMVQDALNEGASSVQVLRLPDVEELVNNGGEPPPEGQINENDISGEGWSLLTFDELGTQNPTYTRDNPLVGLTHVTTHACFEGQSVIHLPSGAYSLSGSVPTVGQALVFDLTSGFYTQIKEDGANPNTPVLAGSVGYDSPISVLFDVDVHAIALTGGFFNQVGSTYIEAYDRLGHVLGSAINTQSGIETFGFSVGSQAKIAGFSFYVNNTESSGFAIDNLRFK